ncbi:retinol dehydrogenase 12-like isoform X2 [Dermacentor andersoni]|uniref:retinol dehydrogenase 12-like isoform X2 n=1 Tax=Dermacentor andersoni TaxID=34620 RepID=UPI002417F574|nr:retinol dehydrogenase 12-like isoform X2 [Dermacentor andersoni]
MEAPAHVSVARHRRRAPLPVSSLISRRARCIGGRCWPACYPARSSLALGETMWLLACFAPAALLLALFAYNRLSTRLCRCKADLSGRTVVITGANAGIGYETARQLALRGARLVLGCRNEERARRAVERLASETRSTAVSWLPLDTSSPDSVRAFVERLLRLTGGRVHVLVNNAATAADDDCRRLTAEGHELVWATNYLGHYLLTRLLLRVSVCAVHPGVVNTPVARGLTRVKEPWFGLLSTLFGVKTVREACETTVHAVVATNPCSGWYLSDCRARWPAARCPDDERDAGRLWALSELAFPALPPVGEGSR